jgi:hypothetical protein
MELSDLGGLRGLDNSFIGLLEAWWGKWLIYYKLCPWNLVRQELRGGFWGAGNGKNDFVNQ